MSATRTASQPGLVGVGYEGRTVDELVADLVHMGVSRLVDIRLTPISRKPGLSKLALARALTDAGIAYEHRRELGNPKTNRAGFAGPGGDQRNARARYAALLRESQASDALDAVANAGMRELVALMCFETDQTRCHRDVVLREARRRLTSAAASTPPGH